MNLTTFYEIFLYSWFCVHSCIMLSLDESNNDILGMFCIQKEPHKKVGGG